MGFLAIFLPPVRSRIKSLNSGSILEGGLGIKVKISRLFKNCLFNNYLFSNYLDFPSLISYNPCQNPSLHKRRPLWQKLNPSSKLKSKGWPRGKSDQSFSLFEEKFGE
jgi:hypothetical protein